MVVCSSLISHALPETGRAAYAQDGARGPEHSRTLPGLRSLLCQCGDAGSWLGEIPLDRERLCQDFNPQGGPRGSVPHHPASLPHRLTSG